MISMVIEKVRGDGSGKNGKNYPNLLYYKAVWE